MILGPIFEFGKNKRRVDIQKAEAEIAVNNYLNTYRTALGDVENSLVGITDVPRENMQHDHDRLKQHEKP